MKTLYFSIRVIEAENEQEAFEKIMNEDFCETHELCDTVVTIDELKKHLNDENQN